MASAPKPKAKQQAPVTKAKPKADNSSGFGSQQWLTVGILAAILVLTWFIYKPVGDYGFTNWDDDVYVTENAIIGHPENTHKMMTTPVAGNYHPLTMYSLAYDYAKTIDLPEDQRGHRFHIMNVFFHLLNILLVFYFTFLLSGKRLWMSLTCALFFAIHPMHVESVAWVAERKDVLYTFFFFIALLSYLVYMDTKKYLWLSACLITFVLSLASKPAAVILPLVLLAIDYFRNRKLTIPVLAEKIPFFILSVVAGLLTVTSQKASGAIDEGMDYSFAERILFPFYNIMMYSFKLIYPFNLSAVYPFPNVQGQPMGPVFYIAPVVVLAALGALLYFGRNKRIVMFGVAFFLINIALILQFFNVGQSIMSERYTYVAYLGLFMLMTWWLDEKTISGGVKMGIAGALALLGIIYVSQSVQRVKVWQNDETLWTDVIEKFPRRVPDSYNNLGYYYRHHAQPEKALANYAMALQLNPKDPKPWGNRGNIFFDARQFDSAIANYNHAIALSNKEWETLSNRGASRAQTGDLPGALEDLTLAVAGEPNSVSAWNNRALVYGLLNRHEEAIADYRKSLEIDPRAHNVVNAIGVEYQRMGKFAESLPEFARAIQLAPDAGMYYLNRSYSYTGMGNQAAAIQDLEKAKSLGTAIPADYLQRVNELTQK